MKKQILTLPALLLTCLLPTLAQEKINAEITYINNEGFMIKNNEKKIFIDALYNYQFGGGIPNTEPYIREKIMKGETPFDGSELYLVTHEHPDHYDQVMVSTYLENHPQSFFVGDSATAKPLVTKFGNQIFSPNPVKHEKIDTTINGFPLTVFNLIHDTGYRLYNLGYWVDIDGLRIFHTGDNTLDDMKDTTEYLNTELFSKPIDIAFLDYNTLLRTASNADFFKRHLKANYIILMHITETGVDKVRKQIEELGDGFPPILVFSTSMEKLAINDSTYFSNLMPKKTGTMNDTVSFGQNIPFSIEIPELFTDPDGDPITYSSTGLPSGTTFNSNTMTISGNVAKVGKYTVKIIGTDSHYTSNTATLKLIIEKNTGIERSEIPENYIYPNPARSEIKFSRLPATIMNVQIFDMRGCKVLDQPLGQNPLDISMLDKGIFVVKLIDRDKVTSYNLIKN